MKTLDEAYEPIVIEDEDDIGSNRSTNRPLVEIVGTRLSRRAMLRGFVTTAAVGVMGGTLTSRLALGAAENGPSTLTFTQPDHVILEDHQVAPGYRADVLIRWGDQLFADSPEWDPDNQTAEAQAKQFGYNCDYLAYFSLPRGSDNSEHGLLHANHEYTSPELMFPGWTKRVTSAEEARALTGEDKEYTEEELAHLTGQASVAAQTPEQSRIEMMAHNGSVIEVRKENGRWRVVPNSQYARRITLDTEMRISGPAAGHDRMKTNYDPSGTKVSARSTTAPAARRPGARC